MLVSTHVDHRAFFSGLRAVVVDEVHAFAGRRPGLAPVGRPRTAAAHRGPSPPARRPVRDRRQPRTSCWFGSRGPDTGSVPAASSPPTHGHCIPRRGPCNRPETSNSTTSARVANAATVIAALHRGEKRLVFCESRRTVEELGEQLRLRGVTTFLSHASLSVDERKRAEEAFAEARDCVIVSTSTLELGIDVGDLDRVIQLDAPRTVAAFLQRLGRTGRRSGTSRNCLFLALDEDGLLAAAALLLQWSRDWVEPVTPPPEPRHHRRPATPRPVPPGAPGRREPVAAVVGRPRPLRPGAAAHRAASGRTGLPRPGRRACCSSAPRPNAASGTATS